MSRSSAGKQQQRSSTVPSTSSSSQANEVGVVTGVLFDSDYVTQKRFDISPNAILEDISDPLFKKISFNIKKDMNVNLDKKPFTDKKADLKVYFGSDYVHGGNNKHVGDLQPDTNQLLFAFHSGPVAREIIKNKRAGLEMAKNILGDEPTKTGGSSNKKEKGRADNEQDLSRRFEQLAAEVNRLKAADTNHEGEINQLKAENKNMRVQHEGEINQLKATVQRISNEIARLNVRALHRRVMLDKIRDKLVDREVITDDFKPTQNSNTLNRIVPLVTQGLRENRNTHGLKMLSHSAIRAIFDTGPNTLRNSGNMVAHEAANNDISEAVHDSGLSQQNRDNAKELFMWLNDDQKPTPQRSA